MEWEWKLTSNNRKHLPQTGKTLHLSGLKFHFLGHILLPIFMIIFPMFSLYNFKYLVAIYNFKKTVSYNWKSMLSLILMIFWWLVLLFLEPLFSRLRKSTDFSSNFWENGIIFVSVSVSMYQCWKMSKTLPDTFYKWLTTFSLISYNYCNKTWDWKKN